MRKVKVEVQRSVVQTVVIEVEAEDAAGVSTELAIAKAKEVALDKAGDIDFSGTEKEADYTVTGVFIEEGI